MIIRENVQLTVSNPLVIDPTRPICEAMLADIKISGVKAVYPFIRAINAERLTKNFTFYPAESLIGNGSLTTPTGYASFVKPYGKPVIREHRDHDVQGLGTSSNADVPMGRIIFAGYKARTMKDGASTAPEHKYIPGTVEGNGYMCIVPAITDPEAITKVLGGIYHTVSIGSKVDDVWESISGRNIAEMKRRGEDPSEIPDRGQLYVDKDKKEEQLSYWKMGPISGIELSYVNVPSDIYAGTINPDIGEKGMRLLVAEKKVGAKEFSFFDAKTSERVELDLSEVAIDESHVIDSIDLSTNVFWAKYTGAHTESVNSPSKEGEERMNFESLNLQDILKLEITEDSKTELIAYFETLTGKLDDSMVKYAEALAVGETFEVLITNEAGFRETQDFVTKVLDWGLEAAKYAVALFVEKGEAITIVEDRFLTMGEMFGTEDTTETEWSYKTALENADTFAGDKMFPTICGALSLKMLEAYKGEDREAILEKLLKANPYFAMENDKLVYHPFKIGETPLYVIRNAKEALDFKENLPLVFAENVEIAQDRVDEYAVYESRIAETLEIFAKVMNSEATLKDTFHNAGWTLTEADLVQLHKKSQFSAGHKELAALVGLVRNGKITKEQVDDAYNSYKVFGTSVLNSLYEKAASSIKNEEKEEDDSSSTQESVEVLPNPVVAVEVTKATEATKAKKDVWAGLRTRSVKGTQTPGRRI